METILTTLKSLSGAGIVIIAIIIVLLLNTWIFNKIKSVKTSTHVIRNSIVFFVVLFGILVFILALSIDKNLKGQILSFLGIIISAGIALSSITVLGNLIAGIMNNSMNRFKNGDLIHLDNLQGRVTKKMEMNKLKTNKANQQ